MFDASGGANAARFPATGTIYAEKVTKNPAMGTWHAEKVTTDPATGTSYAENVTDNPAMGTKRIERNSGMTTEQKPLKAGGNIGGHLKSFVERIERLNEEKMELQEDISNVFLEAKFNGFDTKALRAIIKLRKQDKAEREELEAVIDQYMHALDMID